MFQIIGRQGSNEQGTRKRPFQGTGIALRIVGDGRLDSVNSWTYRYRGDFCSDDPASFAIFGGEGRTPTLSHPRVRSGMAEINIGVRINGTRYSRTFYVTAHPQGCRAADLQPGDASRSAEGPMAIKPLLKAIESSRETSPEIRAVAVALESQQRQIEGLRARLEALAER